MRWPLRRRVLPPTRRNVPAQRSSASRAPLPSDHIRRDPVVTAGIIGAVATLVAAVVTAVVTLVTVYHPPATQHDTNGSQSQASCTGVAEDYYTQLQRNPGIIGALIVVATTDPDARRCGINATTIELMENGMEP